MFSSEMRLGINMITTKEKLLDYGFTENNGVFSIRKAIPDKHMDIAFLVILPRYIHTVIIDNNYIDYTDFIEPGVNKFNLNDEITKLYFDLFNDIKDKCFFLYQYKSDMYDRVLSFVKKTYGTEPYYPTECITEEIDLIDPSSGFWYGSLSRRNRTRLDQDIDELVEVLTLRARAKDLPEYLKIENVYPHDPHGKQCLYSICLSDLKDYDFLYKQIKTSHRIAKAIHKDSVRIENRFKESNELKDQYPLNLILAMYDVKDNIEEAKKISLSEEFNNLLSEQLEEKMDCVERSILKIIYQEGYSIREIPYHFGYESKKAISLRNWGLFHLRYWLKDYFKDKNIGKSKSIKRFPISYL